MLSQRLVGYQSKCRLLYFDSRSLRCSCEGLGQLSFPNLSRRPADPVFHQQAPRRHHRYHRRNSQPRSLRLTQMLPCYPFFGTVSLIVLFVLSPPFEH